MFLCFWIFLIFYNLSGHFLLFHKFLKPCYYISNFSTFFQNYLKFPRLEFLCSYRPPRRMPLARERATGVTGVGDVLFVYPFPGLPLLGCQLSPKCFYLLFRTIVPCRSHLELLYGSWNGNLLNYSFAPSSNATGPFYPWPRLGASGWVGTGRSRHYRIRHLVRTGQALSFELGLTWQRHLLEDTTMTLVTQTTRCVCSPSLFPDYVSPFSSLNPLFSIFLDQRGCWRRDSHQH
jgi:hypothetical protein